jgi:type I restriction enzyme R subunit
MDQAGYTPQEAERIKKQVEDHTEMRNAIKIASFDDIDLKRYEPEMRQLLDMYLTADPTRTISNFGDTTLLNLIVDNGIEAGIEKLPNALKSDKNSVAETLEANMRKVITQEMPINPMYYERMSVLLEELVRRRKESALNYEDLLKEYEELAKKLYPQTSDQYPQTINTAGKRALYDNLEKNESLAEELSDILNDARPDGWVGVTIKERMVRNAIREPLAKYGITAEEDISRLIELIANQQEFQ